MKTETIERRIKGFHFWKNVNGVIMLACFGSLFFVTEELKVYFICHQLFFFAISMSCKWFEQMYKDMKEK